jgi:hypothetical protein
MRTLMIAVAAVAVAGCASYRPKDLVIPENVSLYAALEEIGCSFRAMREAEQGFKVGEIPADMKVTLNVTVSSKDGGKLSVSPSRVVPTTVIGTAFAATAEHEQSSEASRGNTIEINFRSLPLYVLDKVTTQYGKDLKADDVKKLIDTSIEQAPYFASRNVTKPPRDIPLPGARGGAGGKGDEAGSGEVDSGDVCARYRPKNPPHAS